MYQRPEAVRVVVKPAIQPGRADRRSVRCEQTERREKWGPTWRRRGRRPHPLSLRLLIGVNYY